MGDAHLLWQRTMPPTNLTRYNLTSFAITLNELTLGLQVEMTHVYEISNCIYFIYLLCF